MKNKPESWFEYLNTLRLKNFSPNDLDGEAVDRILRMNNSFNTLMNSCTPWVYLLDYTSCNYVLISKSVKYLTDYPPERFLDGGLGFTFEIYERNHLRIFNEEIFPDRLAVIKKVPFTQHPDYIFSHNFQVKKKNGESVNILQRSCFIKSDENGNPLLNFGVISDITHFHKGNTVVQTVEKASRESLEEKTHLIFKKSYFVNEEDKLFTKREKELLLWMADGLTSKAIAGKFFISENTVINHRRNMQEKSNTKNVAELVSFAVRQGII